MKKLLTLIILLWAAPAFCTPSISNVTTATTFVDGQTITVSGSGFGANAGLAKTTWLGGVGAAAGNIESGTDEADFSESTWYLQLLANQPHAKYDTGDKWSGNKSIRFSRINGWPVYEDYANPARWGDSATADDWYITFYAKAVATSGAYGQWKIYRLSYASNVVDGAGTILSTIYAGTRYFTNLCLNADPSNSACIPSGTILPEVASNSYAKDAWQKFEIMYKENSAAGASDGVIRVNTITSSGTIRTAIDRTDMITRGTGMDTYKKKYFWLQSYLGNGITGGDVWVDDVFVQKGSRAHIDISKNATYSARGLSEVQVPATWGSSSITATFNRGGAFTTGDQFYVYVTDENGLTNATGKGPYTVGDVGGPADTTPPVLSSPLPTGAQTCTTDPRNVTLQITSNEASTVKYDTTDKSYDTMTYTFGTTGETSHSTVVSNTCGTSKTYYCRAMDSSGNKDTSSTTISYTVGSAPVGDIVNPTIAITDPATNPYDTTSHTVVVSGVSYDETLLAPNTASCPTCQATGAVTGTTSWSIPLTLSQGTLGIDLLYGQGAFAATGLWNLTSNWTISGGVISNSGASTNSWLSHPFNAEAGERYKLYYEVTAYTSGSLYLSQYGFSGTTTLLDTSAGTHTLDLTCSQVAELAFVANNWIGTLDNVLIKKNQRDVLTMTAHDAAGNTSTTSISLGYTAPSDVPRKVVGLGGVVRINLGNGIQLEF